MYGMHRVCHNKITNPFPMQAPRVIDSTTRIYVYETVCPNRFNQELKLLLKYKKGQGGGCEMVNFENAKIKKKVGWSSRGM